MSALWLQLMECTPDRDLIPVAKMKRSIMKLSCSSWYVTRHVQQYCCSRRKPRPQFNFMETLVWSSCGTTCTTFEHTKTSLEKKKIKKNATNIAHASSQLKIGKAAWYPSIKFVTL